MGDRMRGRHPRPSPQWALTRSKVQRETTGLPLLSAPLQKVGRTPGCEGVWTAWNPSNPVVSEQLSLFPLLLSN